MTIYLVISVFSHSQNGKVQKVVAYILHKGWYLFCFSHHCIFLCICNTKHNKYLFSKHHELLFSELMNYNKKFYTKKKRKNKEWQSVPYFCVLTFFPLHPFSLVSGTKFPAWPMKCYIISIMLSSIKFILVKKSFLITVNLFIFKMIFLVTSS